MHIKWFLVIFLHFFPAQNLKTKVLTTQKYLLLECLPLSQPSKYSTVILPQMGHRSQIYGSTSHSLVVCHNQRGAPRFHPRLTKFRVSDIRKNSWLVFCCQIFFSLCFCFYILFVHETTGSPECWIKRLHSKTFCML